MTVRIRVRPGGPLVVETDGSVELYGVDQALHDTSGMSRLLLCRCGASRSAPFCDGSHNRVAFERPAACDEEDGACAE